MRLRFGRAGEKASGEDDEIVEKTIKRRQVIVYSPYKIIEQNLNLDFDMMTSEIV